MPDENEHDYQPEDDPNDVLFQATSGARAMLPGDPAGKPLSP
jgi:hypothetical protein